MQPVRPGLAGSVAISEPPTGDPGLELEAALYCEPCGEGRHYSRRQRAHILGLTHARPDSEQPRDVRSQGEPEAMTKLMPDRARSARKRPQTSLRPFVV